MIGVTRYHGTCGICSMGEEEREDITSALLTGAREFQLVHMYPGLRLRDFRQHYRQCMAPLTSKKSTIRKENSNA